MHHHTFGPIELYLIGFDGDHPSPQVIDELEELVRAATIRLLDVLIIQKSSDGSVAIIETDDASSASWLLGLELAAPGVVGEEDVSQFAELVAPDESAVLITIEHTWASRLASRVSASGATLLASERIPAPVVNALLDSVMTRG